MLTDPLGGPGSARLVRWITAGYGPVIWLAPWLWGAAYYASNSRPAMRLLRGALLQLADRATVAAVARHRPAVLVSFHPLTGTSAVRARDLIAPGTPVITVVTDLGAPHAAWRQAGVDLIIGPSATDRGPWAADGTPWAADGTPSAADGTPSAAGGQVAVAGLATTRDFWAGQLRPAERAKLGRSLGLPEHRFVVLLTGGGRRDPDAAGTPAGAARARARRGQDLAPDPKRRPRTREEGRRKGRATWMQIRNEPLAEPFRVNRPGAAGNVAQYGRRPESRRPARAVR